MIDLKIIRSTIHFGWAYRPGATCSLPDEVAQMFIKEGYAVAVGLKKRREPEVFTTDIKPVVKSRKRKR